MKWLSVGLLVVACFPSAQICRLENEWLYLSDPLKWERGYRPGDAPPELAEARILILEPQGTFIDVSCVVYQRSDGKLSILYSEGYTMGAGNWTKEQKQKRILVRCRTIHSDVLGADHSTRAEMRETFEYGPPTETGRLAGRLRSLEFGTRFVPLNRLDDLSGLADLIAFHFQETKAEEKSNSGLR
jgi:hypothetical protein